MKEKPAEGPVIVLFDGDCLFCNGVVRFLVRRDPGARYRFASLRSRAGIALKSRWGVSDAVDSVVVIAGGRVLLRSDAALEISRHLPRPWRWLALLRAVPRPVRDAVYRLVARHRHRLFRRRNACRMPTPEIRSRFLEEPE